VHGLAPRLGWAAIFAMVLPYNMLHYGKPMPEALAAIVGGIVLGTLSVKTRSIWLGVALHISVAITMDLSALGHARWW
jgi:membrane protease YdiL (CAAX protease family)